MSYHHGRGYHRLHPHHGVHVQPTITNQLTQQHTEGFGVESFSYDRNGDPTSINIDALGSGHYVNFHLRYDAAERSITVTTLQTWCRSR